MKVLIATGLYAPEIGGPATHTEILEREMPALGVEVAVLPFSRVRRYPKVIRHVLYLFLLLFRSRGAHLIYALDPVSVGLPAFFASKLSGKPFVLRVAGDYAWEQAVGRYGAKVFLDQFNAHLRRQPLPVQFLSSTERFVARQAVRVVVPSEYLKRIVLGWGVTEEKIQVVYNAYMPPIIEASSREIARARFGLQGTVVASVGRFVSWKGFRALIDAIAEIHTDHPHITCIIVGEGPDHAALTAHVKERKVGDCVRFLPAMPQADLNALLSGVDVFVLNTAYEGFSHQLLEVMALGVPIITTPVGGNGELIEHGKTGLFVTHDDVPALAEAIVRLAEHPTIAAPLAAAAKERAFSFNVPNMTEGVKRAFIAASE